MTPDQNFIASHFCISLLHMSQSGFKFCLYFDQLSAQATDKPTADSDIADVGDPDIATATETEVDGDDDEEDSDGR